MEEKKETKPKAKKKKNSKVDMPSVIFFVVMIVGLIVLTIILLTKPTSKIYTTTAYEPFVVSVEIYSNNKVDIAIDAGEDRVIQAGTYEEIKDDDIENNFSATFVDEDETTGVKTETHATLTIEDSTLTLLYDSGESIILEEKK